MLGETPVGTPVTPAGAAGGLFQPQAERGSEAALRLEEMDTQSSSGATSKGGSDPLGMLERQMAGDRPIGTDR